MKMINLLYIKNYILIMKEFQRLFFNKDACIKYLFEKGFKIKVDLCFQKIKRMVLIALVYYYVFVAAC